MNFTNRLCNPTPYKAKLNFHAGITITIDPDGHKDLPADQARDFQKGQPGSESVQELLAAEGLFMLDLDRSYEVQALEALDKASRGLLSRYSDMVNRMRRDRAAQGISDNQEAFDEVLAQTGYAALKERADALQGRAKFLRSALDKNKAETPVQKIDPDRTIPFTNPPRVFPSPLALQMFLSDKANAGLKTQWERWYKDVTKPVAKTGKVEADVESR